MLFPQIPSPTDPDVAKLSKRFTDVIGESLNLRISCKGQMVRDRHPAEFGHILVTDPALRSLQRPQAVPCPQAPSIPRPPPISQLLRMAIFLSENGMRKTIKAERMTQARNVGVLCR